jgi:uncharacterized protein (DUF362 family)
MEKEKTTGMNRRDFIKSSVVGLAGLKAVNLTSLGEEKKKAVTKVALVKTQDRIEGIRQSMKLLDFPSAAGKNVLLKPNFNTADPTPGSTHNDTLVQLIKEFKERKASSIVVGERSGPPETKEVMAQKGIFKLSEELDFGIINFEELEEKDWIHFNPENIHWKEGFYVPRSVTEAEYIVSTCCLKTHQYGGIFTLSLKLAVGLTPKRLMRELHRSPDMRKMIAEINLAYKPQLVVLDGIEAFVDGGPSEGTKKNAGVVLAGTDRVAVDAVGVAVLKELGSNEAIMGRKIFEQEQIKRAAELGIGISSPEQIEFVTADTDSQKYADKLKSILMEG